MALDLSGLSAYVKDNANNIVTEAVLGFKSKQYLTVQPGIKSSENITKLVTEASLQAGACGWSPSGTTTLSKRNLAVVAYKSQEALCSQDFNSTFLQIVANAGSHGEDIPLEERYVDNKVATIGKALDAKIWQENDTTGDFAGFLQIVTDDVPSGNKFSRTSSVMDDIDSLLTEMPAEALVAEGLYVYMSVANYLGLMVELRDKNLFHHATGNSQAMEFVYPGTNITVVGLVGMGASNAIIMANRGNMFVGTDLENDFEVAKYEFEDFEDEHRFNFKAKIGAQIAIPEEVVAAV